MYLRGLQLAPLAANQHPRPPARVPRWPSGLMAR